MGTLRHTATGTDLPLRARSLAGRSRRAHVQCTSRRASGEHALLTWDDGGWVVRDLGSRNGTTVDGQTVEIGARVSLRPGSTVSFGDPSDTWHLITETPPTPLATDGTRWVQGEAGLVGLPDLDDPAALIERTSRGWVHGDTLVEDLGTIELDGATWTLHLPEDLPATAEAGGLTLDRCGVRLRVSADQEYIQAHVALPDRTETLPARAHHEILHLLVQQRITDRDGGALPEAEHGWIYSTQLEKALRASSNQIYVGIHRLRKEFEGLGLLDGRDVVERRRTTRQVRIAVPQLTIEPLA